MESSIGTTPKNDETRKIPLERAEKKTSSLRARRPLHLYVASKTAQLFHGYDRRRRAGSEREEEQGGMQRWRTTTRGEIGNIHSFSGVFLDKAMWSIATVDGSQMSGWFGRCRCETVKFGGISRRPVVFG